MNLHALKTHIESLGYTPGEALDMANEILAHQAAIAAELGAVIKPSKPKSRGGAHHWEMFFAE